MAQPGVFGWNCNSRTTTGSSTVERFIKKSSGCNPSTATPSSSTLLPTALRLMKTRCGRKRESSTSMTIFVKRRAASGIPRYRAGKTLPSPRTRTNRVAVEFHDQLTCFYLDFAAELPDELFSTDWRGDLLAGIHFAQRDEKPASNDLGRIRPPGGVPLFPSGSPITVQAGSMATQRLEAAPQKDLDKWVVELERTPARPRLPPALIDQAIAAAGGGAKGLGLLTTIDSNRAAIEGVISVAPVLETLKPYSARLDRAVQGPAAGVPLPGGPWRRGAQRRGRGAGRVGGLGTWAVLRRRRVLPALHTAVAGPVEPGRCPPR